MICVISSVDGLNVDIGAIAPERDSSIQVIIGTSHSRSSRVGLNKADSDPIAVSHDTNPALQFHESWHKGCDKDGSVPSESPS